MILSPAIISLILSSLLTALFAVYASAVGYRIIRHWQLDSGSELQLRLERKTYLVSTVMAALFGISLFCLFFFVFTVDGLHPLFVGAMCAAGALNVNPYGYPVLFVKVATCVLGGIWLIVNHADGKAVDYPLIRFKYKLLIVIAGLLIFEVLLLVGFFWRMAPNLITSCCGTLFSADADTIAGRLATLPSIPAKVIFYLSVVLTLRTGSHFFLTARAAPIFSYLSAWLFGFSFIAIMAFISLYIYELPTHHCPFCLLQKEYYYIGYPLYLSLFGAGITGMSVGVLNRLKGPDSMRSVIPAMQKKLALVSMAAFIVFTAIATYPIVFSDFRLEGY